MGDRLRISAPVCAIAAAVATVILAVIIPDVSTLVLSVILVANIWIALLASAYLQRRAGVQ